MNKSGRRTAGFIAEPLTRSRQIVVIVLLLDVSVLFVAYALEVAGETRVARTPEFVAKASDPLFVSDDVSTLMDSYAEQDDWDGMLAAARDLLADDELMKDAALKTMLIELRDQSSFKTILYDKRATTAQTAARFVAFADAFPESAFAAIALVNAAAMLERLGEWERAIRTRVWLIETYKTSPHVIDQMDAVAATCAAHGDVANAARWRARALRARMR